MAIDERARHQLHRKLEEVLGSEEAGVLMAHLPPVGWADVATKHDLDHLGEMVTMKIESVEARLETKIDAAKHEVVATNRADMIRLTHNMVLAQAGTVLAVAGLAFAAARLT
jgi:hypothetical protein